MRSMFYYCEISLFLSTTSGEKDYNLQCTHFIYDIKTWPSWYEKPTNVSNGVRHVSAINFKVFWGDGIWGRNSYVDPFLIIIENVLNPKFKYTFKEYVLIENEQGSHSNCQTVEAAYAHLSIYEFYLLSRHISYIFPLLYGPHPALVAAAECLFLDEYCNLCPQPSSSSTVSNFLTNNAWPFP